MTVRLAGARFGEYQTALKLGRLGYELVERCGLKRFQAGAYIMFGNLVMPWTQHVKSGRDLVCRGVDVATRNGDVIYAAYGYANLIRNMLAAGDPLAETQHEADDGLDAVTSGITSNPHSAPNSLNAICQCSAITRRSLHA